MDWTLLLAYITGWKAFIRTHLDVLVATDFFTAEVWTLERLFTYYYRAAA